MQRQQLLAGVAGHGAKPGHVQRIECAGAVGQALLHAHMLEIGMDGGGEQRQVLCRQILRRNVAFREPVPVRCSRHGLSAGQPRARVSGTGRMRDRAALARAEMRERNSVPMVASKRSGSGDPSTSMPKALAGLMLSPSCSVSRARDWAASGSTSQPPGSKPMLGPQNGMVSDAAKDLASSLTPMV